MPEPHATCYTKAPLKRSSPVSPTLVYIVLYGDGSGVSTFIHYLQLLVDNTHFDDTTRSLSLRALLAFGAILLPNSDRLLARIQASLSSG